LVTPRSRLVAGPLADHLFELAMQEGGALVEVFADLVGQGPGAGLGLIFALFGALAVLVVLNGYVFPTVRKAEVRLVDRDAVGSAV
jgi:MFS transporter, DHA3 family, macrolide efflux protein